MFAFLRPWVQSPVPHKVGVLCASVVPALGIWKQEVPEYEKFKVIRFIVSLTPTSTA